MTLPTGVRSVTSKYMDALDITAKKYQIFHKGTSPKVGKNPVFDQSDNRHIITNVFERK